MMDALLSPRRRALLQALGAAALTAGCGERAVPLAASRPALHFSGETIGTTYNVRLAGAVLAPEREAEARRAVQGAFDAVVARMSTYDPTSELSRFNGHASTAPFAMSAELLQVFVVAQGVSTESAGAFDISVAPLVDAWGFGPAKHREIPAPATLARLGVDVGYRKLAIDRAASVVRKTQPALAADLSGIAKGYGVDRAALALEALGHADYMVEAGGEVRTRGRNASDLPWQIAIEQPDAMPPRPRFIAPLSGQSMATSGDYRIYYERDGRRYSHEIDPATREPVTHRLASVSVVAADCTYADAMATALFVLGPERGPALAAERGLAALFVVRTADGGFIDRPTPAFAALGGRTA
jgi:thiamine biosynthesis lipoprotein